MKKVITVPTEYQCSITLESVLGEMGVKWEYAPNPNPYYREGVLGVDVTEWEGLFNDRYTDNSRENSFNRRDMRPKEFTPNTKWPPLLMCVPGMTKEVLSEWKVYFEDKEVADRAAWREGIREWIRSLQSEVSVYDRVGSFHSYFQNYLEEGEKWLYAISCFEKLPQAWEEACQAEEAWQLLLSRQAAGEILLNFGGFSREYRRANNRKFWVICPDGTSRFSDGGISYPGQDEYHGTDLWGIVTSEELALVWSKSIARAPHDFEVVWLPQGGCTSEQLARVVQLESEIDVAWKRASGEDFPEVGQGWGLWDHSNDPQRPTPDLSLALDESGKLNFEAAKELLRARFQGK